MSTKTVKVALYAQTTTNVELVLIGEHEPRDYIRVSEYTDVEFALLDDALILEQRQRALDLAQQAVKEAQQKLDDINNGE